MLNVMEETYITKIIVLNRWIHREHDSKILAFSPELGKIDLVVRGAQKNTSKLSAHIEPMNLGKVMIVRGRNCDYLGGIDNERNFRNIKTDFDKIRFSLYNDFVDIQKLNMAEEQKKELIRIVQLLYQYNFK